MERTRRQRSRKQPRRSISDILDLKNIKLNLTKKQLLFFVLIPAAVILLALMIFGAVKLFRKEDKFLKVDFAFDGQIYATSNSIYYIKDNVLYCTDLSGKELWSQSYDISSLEIVGSDTFICVFNEKTAIVTGPNQEKRFTVTPRDYIIKGAYCGNDVIVFLTETREQEPATFLRAFDINGNDLQRFEIADCELLQYGLSGKIDNLWTLVLDCTGIEPISRITVSNPAQNKMTGIIEISDQLVYRLIMGDNNMYLMGTNNLVQYNNFNEKLSETLIYGLKCVDSVEIKQNNATTGVFLFVSNDIGPGDDIFNVHLMTSQNGKSPSSVLLQLPKGIRDVFLSKDRIICFGDSSIYLYKHNGEFDTEIRLESRVTDVRKLTDELILISEEDGVYLYKV